MKLDFCISQEFIAFATANSGHKPLLATTFWKNTKRYAYLAIGNLRNFRFDAGDSIVVLTRIAWATIVTPASWAFSGPPIGTWHSWLTFSFYTVPPGATAFFEIMATFNSYINIPAIDYWRNLCMREGTERHYDKGDYFFRQGEIAKYIGFIKTGTLIYTAISADGTEHVVGLEAAGEFVADFPFSLSGIPARTSVVAGSPSDILCISTKTLRDRLKGDMELREIVMVSTEALFGMVYDRHIALYTKTPEERYRDLISFDPHLFQHFSLKVIASLLNVTPTYLGIFS